MIKKVFKIILTTILIYVLIVGALVLISLLAKEGRISEAWLSLIGYIPFGKGLGTFAVNIYSDTFHMEGDMAPYLAGIEAVQSKTMFVNSCLLLLTAVFFEVVNDGIQKIIGVKKLAGLRAIMMRILCGMGSVLLCTLLGTLLMKYVPAYLPEMPNLAAGAMSLGVSLATIFGSIGVVYLILGVSVTTAVIFVLVKILLVNSLKVCITYAAMLLTMLFMNEKAFLNIFTVFAGWGVILLVIVFIDVLIGNIFHKD